MEKNKANFFSPGYYPGLMEIAIIGKVSIILEKQPMKKIEYKGEKHESKINSHRFIGV